VNVELINTGSELMLGRVLNTHAYWIGRQLADLGYTLTRQVAVPDTGADIQQAVREALGRARVILVTGGLGPTSDDITRQLIAELLGRKLLMDERVLREIQEFFSERKRPMPPNNAVQAMAPAGSIVLYNPNGTAPGLAMEVNPNPFSAEPAWLFMLPGPPRELRPMFLDQVVPLLKSKSPLAEYVVCETWRTTGLGESALAERLEPKLESLKSEGVELGYCAHYGAVDVRVLKRGCGADALVREAGEIIRTELAKNIFGRGDDTLELVVIRELTERHQTLAVAESCTGGAIAHRLTNIPGSSVPFLGGFVTYSNEAKQKFLGVQAETLAQHGAVSEATVREMAEGARRAMGSDYALAVTGIAGPTGGTDAKPVGTVFIALAAASGTKVLRQLNRWDREAFKQVTGNQALELIRRELLE
jgi:nicotinamide-nucleotide amidase